MATITSTPTGGNLTVNGTTQVSGTISWSKPTIPSGATISSCVLTGTATASMSKGSATITVNGTTVTSGTQFTINLGTANNTTSVTTTAKGGNKNSKGTVSFSNLVYTVTYEEAIAPKPTYTVTFKDWDGTTLKTQTVEEGSAATSPSNPTREGYNFTGWDKSFNNITSDLIVTAQYTKNEEPEKNKIAQYKFNNTFYDLIPEFNEGFIYTYEDVVEGEVTTRTIYSNELPTKIQFGTSSESDKASSLVEVDYLNTSNLITMYSMFKRCYYATKINASSWDTSKVTNMAYAFNDCQSLLTIDASNWDTGKVTDMESMFCRCFAENIENSIKNWDVSKVTNMNFMLDTTKSIRHFDLSSWDVNSVIYLDGLFGWSYNLYTINLTGWNTSNVTSMTGMFTDCYSLTTIIGIEDLDTSKVEHVAEGEYGIFTNCYSLTELDLSKWDVSNVTNMSYTFYACSNLTELDLSNWDTSKVTDMNSMFQNCESLTTLDISNFDTSIVTTMSYIFDSCNSLTYVNMDNSNVSSINRIISQLPTKTSSNPGTLKTGAIQASNCDTPIANIKYWNIISEEEPEDVIPVEKTVALRPISATQDSGYNNTWTNIANTYDTDTSTNGTIIVTGSSQSGFKRKYVDTIFNFDNPIPANATINSAVLTIRAKQSATTNLNITVSIGSHEVIGSTLLSSSSANYTADVANYVKDLNQLNINLTSAATSNRTFTLYDVRVDVNYTAYEMPEPTYTVTFKDWNGTTLKTEIVEEGASAIAPVNPTRDGYTFTGWDKDFTNITSDLTVTAQYEKELDVIEWTGIGTVATGLKAHAGDDGYSHDRYKINLDWENESFDIIITDELDRSSNYFFNIGTIGDIKIGDTELNVNFSDGAITIYCKNTDIMLDYYNSDYNYFPFIVSFTKKGIYIKSSAATGEYSTPELLSGSENIYEINQPIYLIDDGLIHSSVSNQENPKYNVIFDLAVSEYSGQTEEPEEPGLTEPVDGYIAKNLVSYGDWSYTFNVNWDTQYLDIEVLNYKYGIFRTDYYYNISNNSYNEDYSHESVDNFEIHGVEVESDHNDINIIRYSKVDGVCIITSNGTQIIPGNAFANDNKMTIKAVIPTEWLISNDGFMTFNIKITDITSSEEPEDDIIEWTGVGTVATNLSTEDDWTYKLNIDWDTQYVEINNMIANCELFTCGADFIYLNNEYNFLTGDLIHCDETSMIIINSKNDYDVNLWSTDISIKISKDNGFILSNNLNGESFTIENYPIIENSSTLYLSSLFRSEDGYSTIGEIKVVGIESEEPENPELPDEPEGPSSFMYGDTPVNIMYLGGNKITAIFMGDNKLF